MFFLPFDDVEFSISTCAAAGQRVAGAGHRVEDGWERGHGAGGGPRGRGGGRPAAGQSRGGGGAERGERVAAREGGGASYASVWDASVSSFSAIHFRTLFFSFSFGSSFGCCERPSLEKAFVLNSFSHTLKRSISVSISLRASVSGRLSLMSEFVIHVCSGASRLSAAHSAARGGAGGGRGGRGGGLRGPAVRARGAGGEGALMSSR